ncbi:expressed unknown protein [Seminavis robusta]|uniref:Uncharacterized protein n=1 Tax=Seminavis robusta TaxID=568900 RepID=A0A9N8DL75_9STRA|nr:expressed unknown protein [Seminavis robusta]|eukprot:Sro185_g080220.1 n/a (210) ;mRNA; r:14501-15130
MVAMFTRILLVSSLLGGAAAFSMPAVSTTSRSATALFSGTGSQKEEPSNTPSRRSFLSLGGVSAVSILTGAAAAANAVQETETRQGIPVTAFNGLIFNYRNSQFGGLDADDLDEPSVSYAEFCEKLQKGEVQFVEFLAPDGDKAYATFKPTSEGGETPAPIRIGEGYPLEQHDGWSSPAFAVRTVKNAGVPYKFTVPGLAKFSAANSKS